MFRGLFFEVEMENDYVEILKCGKLNMILILILKIKI